jgi:hypothetical protein
VCAMCHLSQLLRLHKLSINRGRLFFSFSSSDAFSLIIGSLKGGRRSSKQEQNALQFRLYAGD